MFTRRFQRLSFVTGIAVICVSLLPSSSPVSAFHIAQVQDVLTTTSARWRAVATPQNASPTNQPLVISWSNAQGSAFQIFDVVNSGSVDLIGLTLHVTIVRTSGGNQKPLDANFAACIGGIWTSLDSCSGTILDLGTTSTTLTTTINQAISVSGRLSIRAQTSPSGTTHYSTTVDVSVDGSLIRPGSTTFS